MLKEKQTVWDGERSGPVQCLYEKRMLMLQLYKSLKYAQGKIDLDGIY